MAGRPIDDGPLNGEMIRTGNRAMVITAAEANQLREGPTRVAHLVAWGDDAGTSCTVTMYDDAATTNNPIFRWATATGLGTFAIQTPTENGLRVVVAGTLPTNGGFTVVFE